MNYFYIVFKSRAQTARFSLKLKRSGIFFETVNTPKEIYASCGLSIKVKKDYFNVAKKLVNFSEFTSFQGFYYPVLYNGRIVYQKVF